MMNYIPILLIGALSLICCNKKSENHLYSDSIVGKWKLSAVYADPGDGSGEFEKVDGKKILTFNENGVVGVQNGRLCNIQLSTDESSSSTYNIKENFSLSSDARILEIKNCNEPLHYVVRNNELTIYYRCIEGCGEKFQRITK